MYSESHGHLRSIDEEAVSEAEKAGVKIVLTAGIDARAHDWVTAPSRRDTSLGP